MSLSNRPGRKMAGSIISGLLLAPMTTTLTSASMPSISVSNWLITCSDAVPSSEPIPLGGPTNMSTSKKIMDGAALRPFLKTSRMPFSDSPTHLLKSSGPLIEMKLASLSVATALASIVLPHPGGPKSKMPFGGLIPILLKFLFDLGQPPYIRPLDGGYFDVDLPHRGGGNFSVSVHEIVQVHIHLLKHRARDPFVLQVNLRKIASQ